VLLNVAKTVGRHAVDVAREALDGGNAATASVNRGLRSAGGEILDDVYDTIAGGGGGGGRSRSTRKRRATTSRGGKRVKRRRGGVGIPLDG
jgi:DnaJ-class molecular chaperone